MKLRWIMFFMFVFCSAACKQETYRKLDKRALQSLIDISKTGIEPIQLADAFYYKILKNGRPMMTKALVSHECNGDFCTVSEEFSVFDESVDKIKITIIYSVEGKRIVVKEIRTSFSCQEGRGHTNFGVEPCI